MKIRYGKVETEKVLKRKNSKSIRISVIMPCYNAEKFIYQAIESILNQSFQGFELIIIQSNQMWCHLTTRLS